MSEAWLRVVEIVTPPGGVVVAIAEVYVDESGTHDGSPILSMGGYVFLRSKARRFSKEWSHALRREKLPFFHMTDCALGMDLYKDWTKDRRIEHEKQLIRLIKQTAAFGFSMSISEDVYQRHIQKTNRRHWTPYTFLLQSAIAFVDDWMQKSGFKGKPAFFFESGHRHSSEAHEHISKLARKNGPFEGVSHTFMDKRDAPPLQAADLLAWLSRNTTMKYLEKKPVRRDFLALVQEGDVMCYYDDQMLEAFATAYDGDFRLVPATRLNRHVLLLPEPEA